jgi:hypothetical protein
MSTVGTFLQRACLVAPSAACLCLCVVGVGSGLILRAAPAARPGSNSSSALAIYTRLVPQLAVIPRSAESAGCRRGCDRVPVLCSVWS